MTAVVCLLRGVNVGGHHKIGMEALRDICLSLKLRNPQTYIQSGNVVFGYGEADVANLAARVESAIEKRFGFRPIVMLRTADDIRAVMKRNPFAARKDLEPAKLAVSFLLETPAAEIARRLSALKVGPEELHVVGRELFIYFPDGMGRSKLPAALERTIKIPATARNWNTVKRLLVMAEDLEASI